MLIDNSYPVINEFSFYLHIRVLFIHISQVAFYIKVLINILNWIEK